MAMDGLGVLREAGDVLLQLAEVARLKQHERHVEADLHPFKQGEAADDV